MEKEIESTIVLEKNLNEYQTKKHRIIINEGGTGSSKTISLSQLFTIILMRERNAQLTIARKTMPALRATAMKDFLNSLKSIGAYNENWHNKSELTYSYKPTNSEIDFISVLEPMRIRSRRRNYLWLNEGNEFELEDYRQLSMRTDKQIFLDYNPSHQHHWIYDELQKRKDCITIASTYKDNPFLPEELVKEIEGYKGKDKNYWRIYGLGLKGIAEALIYTHWQYCNELPENADNIIHGLDFGYNNQTALVKIAEKDKNYYWEEKIYQKYLTNIDLIEKLKELVKDGELSFDDIIYADNAEPARIKEIQDAGFNVLPCVKGAIKDGIDKIKSSAFYVTKHSINIINELKAYSWKTKNEKLLEEPVKAKDHLLDGGRYAIVTDDEGKASRFPAQDENEDNKKAKPITAGIMNQDF